MTREAEREEFEKYAASSHKGLGDDWSLDRNRTFPHEYINPYVQQYWEVWQAGMEAGESLGREDSDSVYWPAQREQWKIEFGRELGQQGGHIMNIVDSVRELVREEREECARLAEACDGQDCEQIARAIRARGVASLEKNAKI